MKKIRLDPERLPQPTPAQMERLDGMTDEDIDYSDIPELDDEFFATARQAISTKTKLTKDKRQ